MAKIIQTDKHLLYNAKSLQNDLLCYMANLYPIHNKKYV